MREKRSLCPGRRLYLMIDNKVVSKIGNAAVQAHGAARLSCVTGRRSYLMIDNKVVSKIGNAAVANIKMRKSQRGVAATKRQRQAHGAVQPS
jgi:predicted aspartyl protease